MIYTYINFIYNSDIIEANDPKYSELRQHLLTLSGKVYLVADTNLRQKLNAFTNQLLTFPKIEVFKNTDDVKKQHINELLALQTAMQEHLTNIYN